MLTTVAVFMPLLVMEGELGKMLRWMPIGVITALAVSLIEAFLILPNHLKHSLGKIPKRPSRVRAAINRFEIRTPDGRMMPFHLVATAQRVRGFSQIVRVNRQRSISVTADLDAEKGNARLIMASLKKFFPDSLRRNPGVSLDLEGEEKEMKKTFFSVLRGFVIGMCTSSCSCRSCSNRLSSR